LGTTGATGATAATDFTITIPNTSATDLLSPVAFRNSLTPSAILDVADPTTIASNVQNAFVVGLVIASPTVGSGNVTYQFAGEHTFTNADINNITGSSNFVPGDTYYLGPAGTLTTTRPTTVGQYRVVVGQAIDRTTLFIDPSAPELITADTTIAASVASGATFNSNVGFASVTSLGAGHYRLITTDTTKPDANTIANVSPISTLTPILITYQFGLGGAGTVDVFTYNQAGVSQNNPFSIQLVQLV
jgi:hypothetical protein